MVVDFFNIKERLANIREAGLYRSCPIIEQNAGRTIFVHGIEYLNFTSNDYMGLAQSNVLKDALIEGAKLFGVGTGASPLVTGVTKAHHVLAQKLCAITKQDAVLIFSSGFAANQAIVKALHSLDADLIFDKYTHASMQDAASYIGKFRRFPHGDLKRATSLIEQVKTPVILTEGVFSMDGDGADLIALNQLKDKFNFSLVLDDAHGFGVVGALGHGSIEEAQIDPKVADIYMGTLSKAIGCSGAFVACNHEFAEYLINTSREYIFSTSMPGALCHVALCAINYIEAHSELRSHLKELIFLFKTRFTQECKKNNLHEVELTNSQGAIQPVILKDPVLTLKVASYMREYGVWVGAMRPPTVPRGTSRLRITITAGHTKDDVLKLVHVLVQGIKYAFNR